MSPRPPGFKGCLWVGPTYPQDLAADADKASKPRGRPQFGARQRLWAGLREDVGVSPLSRIVQCFSPASLPDALAATHWDRKVIKSLPRNSRGERLFGRGRLWTRPSRPPI